MDFAKILEMPRAQCRATAKSTGERCKNMAIPGGDVCWQSHGGAAPQVKRKADERRAQDHELRKAILVEVLAEVRARIAAASPVAFNALVENLSCDDPGAKGRAARDLLDRAGLAAPTKVVVDATTRPMLDLSKLTDAEIDQLEALIVKAAPGESVESSDPEVAELDDIEADEITL